MRSRIVTSSLAAISLVLGFSTAFAEEPNRDCRTYEALDHLENGNLGGHRFEVDLASSPIIAVYSEYFGGTRAFTIGFAGTLVGETLHLIGQSSCAAELDIVRQQEELCSRVLAGASVSGRLPAVSAS